MHLGWRKTKDSLPYSLERAEKSLMGLSRKGGEERKAFGESWADVGSCGSFTLAIWGKAQANVCMQNTWGYFKIEILIQWVWVGDSALWTSSQVLMLLLLGGPNLEQLLLSQARMSYSSSCPVSRSLTNCRLSLLVFLVCGHLYISTSQWVSSTLDYGCAVLPGFSPSGLHSFCEFSLNILSSFFQVKTWRGSFFLFFVSKFF